MPGNTHTAAEEVCANKDLVAHILRGMSPETFVAAGRVCTEWRAALAHEEVAASVTQGDGLTKQALVNVYALRSEDADAYPREARHRKRGGTYYVYGRKAREAVLRDTGGYEGLRERLRSRAKTVARLQRMFGYAGARTIMSH